MKITIQPSALSDLRDGYHFYETRESGLGDDFLNAIYSDIDSLHRYAGIHSIHFTRFHRLLSKRFPYGIYYQLFGSTVSVFAILDLRRDPKWIASKLKGQYP